MARSIPISTLIDPDLMKEAEKYRDKGEHVQESTSNLFHRIIKHGLAHAECKEGELNH